VGTTAGASTTCPNPITTSADGSTVYGSPCATQIVVTSESVRTIYGGEGDNTIYAGPDVEAIYGGEGNDVIYAGSQVGLINGGLGNDVIYGEPLEVETGRSAPEGERASASLKPRRRHRHRRKHHALATASIEKIKCKEKVNCLGDNGSQQLEGSGGNDIIFGFRGNDILEGNGGSDALYAGTGDDTLYGGTGDDFVAGGPGNDEMRGQDGKDVLRGDGTTDEIFGGAEEDTVSFSTGVTPGFEYGYPEKDVTHVEGFPEETSGEGRGVYVRLDGGTPCVNGELVPYQACNNWADVGGGGDVIKVSEIENVIGSPFPDIIVGSPGPNKLYGGGGGDVIVGDGGEDSLYGGAEGDYMEGGKEATAYGGAGKDNCAGGVKSSEECGTEARVEQQEASALSAGFMMTASPVAAHDTVYMVGSKGNDEVNAEISGNTVTFESYGSTHFTGEPEGCKYTNEGVYATCTLPTGTTAVDAVLMAGLKGKDHLAVGGGGFELKTSPQLLGGLEDDQLIGSGTTEDVLVDGNDNGNDTLKAYGYDDWLLNNEGKDILEGGNGNDLLLSSTRCDGDTLNGAEGSGDDGEGKNNASWAKMEGAGVTASISAAKAGSYWNETKKEPACSSEPTYTSLFNIDDLEGSNQADALFGDEHANVIIGNRGKDSLYGMAGTDTIIGWKDEEGDFVGGGGGGGDLCRIDIEIDEFDDPGCDQFEPLKETTTAISKVTPKNGSPGSVTVVGRIYASPLFLSGMFVEIEFEKKESGSYKHKFTDKPSLDSAGNYEKVQSVGVGEWRVKSVFPVQYYFDSSASGYHAFTINK